MELTGKCRTDFKKWFTDNLERKEIGEITDGGWFVTEILIDDVWKDLPLSMQYGVFVDFFDSVGIMIDLRFIYMLQSYERIVYFKDRQNSKDTTLYNKLHDTHQEARIESIKKANELYNSI